MLPLSLLIAATLISFLFLTLTTYYRLNFNDLQDIAIGFSRPIWGYSDKPNFLYEIPYYGYESPSISCELYGWRERYGQDVGIVYDTFIFSTELNLLEIRLKELNTVVKHWILVESDRTHTNLPKTLWWHDVGRHQARFAPYLSRIESIVVRGNDIDRSGNFRRSGAYGLEALQRQAIMKGLHTVGIQDGDVFITGDIDEIPKRQIAQLFKHCDLFPPDITLHMPTFIGGFQFTSYEEDKRHTKVRMYRKNRVHPNWVSHHAKIGDTLMLNAGWHCSWCFQTLNQFRFKMKAGVHSDRGSIVSNSFINERLCRGEPPLERRYQRPESYTYYDVKQRWFDKWDVEGRRVNRNTTRLVLPLALRALNVEKFNYLMPGGECNRKEDKNRTRNLILKNGYMLKV